MGYDIHITRRADWANSKGRKVISAEEWLAVAKADPSLRPVPANGPNFYEMVGADGWFDLDDGCVQTKNATPDVNAEGPHPGGGASGQSTRRRR